MNINVLVLLATIAQFILGALWYSPLMFGKWWMQIMEATNISKEELKKMQKAMAPFYALQFFLTLFSTFALVNGMPFIAGLTIYNVSFLILLGLMVPVSISSVLWGNTKKKYWLKQIFVMISMQITGLMLASFILSQ